MVGGGYTGLGQKDPSLGTALPGDEAENRRAAAAAASAAQRTFLAAECETRVEEGAEIQAPEPGRGAVVFRPRAARLGITAGAAQRQPAAGPRILLSYEDDMEAGVMLRAAVPFVQSTQTVGSHLTRTRRMAQGSCWRPGLPSPCWSGSSPRVVAKAAT